MTLQEFIKWLDKEITIPISSDSGAKAFAFVEAREKALTISPLMIQQWEYKVEYEGHHSKVDIKWLQTLGDEGWELCAIADDSEYGGKYIFKRPKPVN